MLTTVLHPIDKYQNMRVLGANRSSIPALVCNVLNFGTIGDETADDTLAIQSAINFCIHVCRHVVMHDNL